MLIGTALLSVIFDMQNEQKNMICQKPRLILLLAVVVLLEVSGGKQWWNYFWTSSSSK